MEPVQEELDQGLENHNKKILKIWTWMRSKI